MKYLIDDIKKQSEVLIKRVINEKETFPTTILIDNISYCNLKCIMCPHKELKRKPRIMDNKLYEKIIDEIAVENPNARVWITYAGEGLIDNDLHKRIKYAKEKGLKDVVLNSNGNLLNDKNSEQLVKAGLDGLYVGIDAFNHETYEKIRVNGNLNKVHDGVLKYKKALDMYGNSSQKLFVQFVKMDENEKELEDFIEYWKSNDVMVKVRPKSSWIGNVPVNDFKKSLERLPCWWAMSMSIADNGLVCSCACDLNCEIAMGDINLQSIKDIWNGRLKDFRMLHVKNEWEKLPEHCRKCNDWQSGYAIYVNE